MTWWETDLKICSWSHLVPSDSEYLMHISFGVMKERVMMRNMPKSTIWINAILAVVLIVLIYGGSNRFVAIRAKTPGLGVRHLHAQGITGRGVSVAIIDGKIRTDHVEYREQLAYYEELSDFRDIPYDAHGPSVTSILVGKDSGVAPGASLYYFALNFAEATPEDAAEALRHILIFNKSLPEDKRIRVVSLSNAWTGQPNEEEYKVAIFEAWQAGVLVITSQMPTITLPRLAIRGVGCPPWKDRDDPRNYEMSEIVVENSGRHLTMEEYFESRAQIDRDKGYATVYVPVGYRTLAGPREGVGGQGYGAKEYYYSEEGGDSRWPPYLTGVLALALQVDPTLTPDEMVTLLTEGVYELDHGFRLIAPEEVVQLARKRANHP